MSTFRFRLERVLSWRETQLSIEEGALELLRFEMRTIEAAVEELGSREAKRTEVIRHARSLSGAELSGIALEREWITSEKKLLHSRIADCLSRIQLKTDAVTKARRSVRLIELLKERRHASWTQDANRRLEELAGESAIGSWRREHRRTDAPVPSH